MNCFSSWGSLFGCSGGTPRGQELICQSLFSWWGLWVRKSNEKSWISHSAVWGHLGVWPTRTQGALPQLLPTKRQSQLNSSADCTHTNCGPAYWHFTALQMDVVPTKRGLRPKGQYLPLYLMSKKREGCRQDILCFWKGSKQFQIS